MSDVVESQAPHPEVDAAWRNVALAEDKLHAVQDEALRLSPFVSRGEIVKRNAVDALWNIAVNHGLCSTHEQKEDVTHVIGMGLKGIATLLPALESKARQSAFKAPDSARREGNAHSMDRALIVQRASDIVPEKVDWIWPGRIARGKHTTIAGDPGTGKSQVMISIIAAVTTGGSWPCGEGRAPLGSVVLLSAEDGIADTIVPRLIAAGADRSRVHIVTATKAGNGKNNQSFNPCLSG